MRRLPFTHLQKVMSERSVQQRGLEVTTGIIGSRRPAGSSGASYSAQFKGGGGTGMTTLAGDYEPGASVVIARHGPGALTYQILGAAPTNKRATQGETMRDIDATNARLL